MIPDIIGWNPVFGMVIQSEGSGTPTGVQLLALFQSVLAEPFQVLSPVRVTVVLFVSIIVDPSHKVYVTSAI